jgi:hypothetical protein
MRRLVGVKDVVRVARPPMDRVPSKHGLDPLDGFGTGPEIDARSDSDGNRRQDASDPVLTHQPGLNSNGFAVMRDLHGKPVGPCAGYFRRPQVRLRRNSKGHQLRVRSLGHSQDMRVVRIQNGKAVWRQALYKLPFFQGGRFEAAIILVMIATDGRYYPDVGLRKSKGFSDEPRKTCVKFLEAKLCRRPDA